MSPQLQDRRNIEIRPIEPDDKAGLVAMLRRMSPESAHARFLADRPNAVRKQVVARLLGMRPETLSRCLTKLEKDGVVDASRGVRVLDQRRLAAIALEDNAA